MGTIIRPSARDRWLSGILSYYTPTICETTARSAMAGNLFAQWLMFDLIEQTSPRISKNLNELKNAVKALDRQVQPWALKGAKPTAEALRRALVIESGLKSMRPRLPYNEADFDATIYDLLDAVGKGIAVLEVDYEQRNIAGLGTIVAPRCTHWVHPRYYGYPPGTSTQDRLMLNSREVGFVNPEFLLAMGDGKDVSLWIDFPEDAFIVSIIKQKSGHPLNASMLRILGFWWAATNFTWDWFLKFAQIFGAPFVWANYEQGASQDTIDRILDMLDQLGGFGRAAFPAGTIIDFKEAITQGTNNPQLLLLDAANTVFDLLILGQTLTSQTGDQGKGGGSYALGQVHAGVRGEKIMATAAEGQRVLNHSLVPSLCRLNFGDDSQCPTVLFCERKTSDPLAMAQRDQVLTSINGVKLVKSEFYDRHELSVPGPDDELIEGQAAGLSAPDPNLKGAEPAPQETAAAKAADASPDDKAKAQIAEAVQTHVRPILERLLLARIKQGLIDGLAEKPAAVAQAAGTSEGARKGWDTRRGMGGAEKSAEQRELAEAPKHVEIPDEHWTGTPKEMHDRADRIMRGFTSVHHPQLGEIKFTRDGRDKTLFDKRTPHEFQSVQALPELTKGGRLVASEPDRKGRPEVIAMHKLEHRLKIGDTPYRAEITVRETRNEGKTAHKFYLHRLKNE
jgi:phage gp29-like protein